jgi:hypothetical protein
LPLVIMYQIVGCCEKRFDVEMSKIFWNMKPKYGSKDMSINIGFGKIVWMYSNGLLAKIWVVSVLHKKTRLIFQPYWDTALNLFSRIMLIDIIRHT